MSLRAEPGEELRRGALAEHPHVRIDAATEDVQESRASSLTSLLAAPSRIRNQSQRDVWSSSRRLSQNTFTGT
jgi:hypothetical protein